MYDEFSTWKRTRQDFFFIDIWHSTTVPPVGSVAWLATRVLETHTLENLCREKSCPRKGILGTQDSNSSIKEKLLQPRSEIKKNLYSVTYHLACVYQTGSHSANWSIPCCICLCTKHDLTKRKLCLFYILQAYPIKSVFRYQWAPLELFHMISHFKKSRLNYSDLIGYPS